MAKPSLPFKFKIAFALILFGLAWSIYSGIKYLHNKNEISSAPVPAVAPAGSASGAGFDAQQYQKREVLRLSGYISEGPALYRLLDCSGQTTGYITESPEDYTGRLIWLDCAAQNRAEEPQLMGDTAILGH